MDLRKGQQAILAELSSDERAEIVAIIESTNKDYNWDDRDYPHMNRWGDRSVPKSYR